jgi:hypothetical protein
LTSIATPLADRIWARSLPASWASNMAIAWMASISLAGEGAHFAACENPEAVIRCNNPPSQGMAQMSSFDDYRDALDCIHFERSDGVLEIRLHTGDGPFAFSERTHHEFGGAFGSVAADPESRFLWRLQ